MGFETINIKDGKHGQAIHIPASMHIDDDKVYLKKAGNALYIFPYNNPWDNLVKSLNDFTDDFMDDRNQQLNQERELFE